MVFIYIFLFIRQYSGKHSKSTNEWENESSLSISVATAWKRKVQTTTKTKAIRYNKQFWCKYQIMSSGQVRPEQKKRHTQTERKKMFTGVFLCTQHCDVFVGLHFLFAVGVFCTCKREKVHLKTHSLDQQLLVEYFNRNMHACKQIAIRHKYTLSTDFDIIPSGLCGALFASEHLPHTNIQSIEWSKKTWETNWTELKWNERRKGRERRKEDQQQAQTRALKHVSMS